MMPIDPPREGATVEELWRWLREFTDDYNRLKDDVQHLSDKDGDKNA